MGLEFLCPQTHQFLWFSPSTGLCDYFCLPFSLVRCRSRRTLKAHVNYAYSRNTGKLSHLFCCFQPVLAFFGSLEHSDWKYNRSSSRFGYPMLENCLTWEQFLSFASSISNTLNHSEHAHHPQNHIPSFPVNFHTRKSSLIATGQSPNWNHHYFQEKEEKTTKLITT